MNYQEVASMLELCRQAAAAGPVEPTDGPKEEFRRCRASLSAELSSLLQDAVAMKWPFMPEKWQYKKSVTSEDKVTLKELISRHLPQLLMFLRVSILAGEPVWAASVVFLVDRFVYWVDTSKTLLKLAEALHKHYPATPIAPQVVIRQARLSLNTGKLQKAEYILSSLINNSGATGCWVYRADSDRVLVQAVSVQIRGQVLQKLGLWIEAAELIWASLIGMHALPEPDRKGIGTSLGLLANILMSMDDTDFHAFRAGQHMDLRILKERGHRLLAAAEAAKMAVVYSQYDSLYVLTSVVIQGTCLLAYSFSAGCGTTEREAILTEAKEAFQIGLVTKREGEVVTSKQELHTLIKAAYSLTVTHKWLGCALEQVREASEECQRATEKLHSYSGVGGGERDVLAAEIMGLVGRVKAVLGVKPFTTSDERSFIPDSYRSAEENPVRFSADHFSMVMGRFQKHHSSVCQAQRTSSKGTVLRSGDEGCSGACVTAMRTTTENLDTEGATENLKLFTNDKRPLGRRPNGWLEGCVDQQCSTDLGNEEEMNGVSRSEEYGFEGMGKIRSPSCSLRDRPASFVDGRARGQGRDGVTCASRKVEKRVDQQCLTEVSDEDGRNICIEDPGSLAGFEVESVSGYRQGPSTSSSGSSALPSSWESISTPDTGSKKGPNQIEASPQGSMKAWVEVGVDLQGETKDGDEDEMKKGTGSKGRRFNGGKSKTPSSTLRDGPPSFDTRGIGKDKDSVSRAKLEVKTWVDQQCPTEFSDEEEMNVGKETSSGGMGKARTASSSLGDSLGSNYSWQKLYLPDTGSPVSSGKDTRRYSDNRTEEGWVELDCPREVKEVEELGETGYSFKSMRRAVTPTGSLGDSLGSSSSWQKLSFSDAGSLLSSGNSIDRPVNGLQPHPSGPLSSAPNPFSGSKSGPRCRSEEDLSFRLVDFHGGVHGTKAALRTNTPKGAPAGDGAHRCNSHLPALQNVDPKAETEDYVLGDLSMSPTSTHNPLENGPLVNLSHYVRPKVSAASLHGVEHPAKPKSFRIMENGEGHEEGDFEKICLDDYLEPSLSNNRQSHDQCFGNSMLEVCEHSPNLTEQDYRALMSGVCHKCLLNRLNIKKAFRLRKHRTAYSALLLKYSKASDRWTSRETKVHIGDPIPIKKEGCQRTAFWVQFLHQEEILGSYVGKTYKFEKEIRYHLNDVERQMTAQHYVTEFNKRLYEKSVPAQIFFIPSEVLLILEGDFIADCVTVEPYMLGDFVKLTNNTVYTNPECKATDYGIAFGHFTYQISDGTEVVVDLQGWVTDSGKGLTYLTDPQIHSVREGGSRSRQGERGIKQFLESQHGPRCNDICSALSLAVLQ